MGVADHRPAAGRGFSHLTWINFLGEGFMFMNELLSIGEIVGRNMRTVL
jgi:hypothetical protein